MQSIGEKILWTHEIWRGDLPLVSLKIPLATMEMHCVGVREKPEAPRLLEQVYTGSLPTSPRPRLRRSMHHVAEKSQMKPLLQWNWVTCSQWGQGGPAAVGAKYHSKSPRGRGNQNSWSHRGCEGSLVTGTLGRESIHS